MQNEMKQITKVFKTMQQAERFQNALYNKYKKVVLISFPIYWTTGTYTWEVK